ncbi:hypothetical protein Q4E93_34400, partial [Flavitalea sp. BT771]|uniref:beta strand repeat-containing protein n=1 Tax=Flavitalea sp. BT771 TaxID=3063329 RepID=UPI0026E3B5A5
TVPVTITEPTPITATTAITNVACNGGATGSVVITPAGGVGPYTITPAQTGLTAGSYTFTVTDANGCSITVPVTITEPTPITATTAVTNVACNGGATGSVVITPAGGVGPYTITPAQTGLTAGSYTFTVTDANGCSITVPVTITEPTPITATTAVTNVACNGGATGSVVITPTGGTAPYTITPAQTGLTAGSYTFTVTDANGCSITVPVTISEPTPITATTAVTNVACNGGATGSVVITPAGGVGPYTITPAQTGLTAGSYTFTVTDANGCSITVPVTITEPTPITATTAVTNVACNGGATGSVVITPTGGTAPYTITPAQTNLAAGSYTFTVTDANGCSITVPVTITEPTPIAATTAVTNVACNGGATGSVVITPTGGTAPYTITPAQTGLTAGSYTFTVTDANGCSITVPVTISEPTPITATTAVTNVACNGGATGSVVITPTGGTAPYTITPAQTNLAAGNYTFTVTDANGCSITVPVTITEPTPITATTAVTNVACNGGATGSVVITPTGGTAPYTITPAQTNLAAGSYTFTVTDANGCSIMVPVTITEPTPITATTAVTNVACNGGATGSVVITPTGGTAPYTITPAQTNLAAGSYTFTVTDANGCSITVPVTITEPTPITATTAVTNVACNGGATGSVVISPAGGVGPYTITPAQTGLTAGSYTFTVTDANGCSITVPVTITEPTPITATTAVTNVACNGGATGSVVITPTGGTAPYTITPAQTGLTAGSYTFTVTDANGCSITVPVTITEPTPITATTVVTNVACNGGATGSVVITPAGGVGPYTITPAQTGLTAGSYTFTVTDANGCSITVPVTITEPTPITATTAVTNVACNGGATGSVVITPTGGTAPYTITPAQIGLTAGSYTFTVTDANGCSITVPVTITEPTPITATTAVTNVACNGGASGSVIITPTGGTAPYTITPAQTGLTAGSYTFTVTDANGCSITVPVTITEPTPITATTAITNVACNGGATGSVVITPAGGVGPYTITPAQTGLTAGSYTFTVTDANGCSITVPVTITEPTPITATAAVTNVACNGGATGSVVITPTGGTAPYTITPTQTGLTAGSYTFTVTDANGCSIIVPVTITEPTPITATTAVTNVACNGGTTGSVVITPTGGTAPYTITPAQTNLAAGSYTFTVTDANGCSITVPVTITEPTPITATTAVTNVACNGGATGSVVITPTGGTAPYTITPAQTGLTAGSYTFTVTDANGCSITVPVTITEPTPITATTAVTNVACNGGATGSVVINPTGGTAPYTITPAQTNLAAGSYTFTVTDANGCSITVPVTITEPTPITATTAVTNVACNGGATGSVVITPTGGTAPYTITPAQTNLAAGSYTFTITDANGCTITVPVTITEPTPITATSAVTNVACNGGATGSVVITPTGGTAPYTITPAQTGLTAGSYTFTVTDANGCSITVPVTITEPTPITATTAVTNVACNGGATGSVVITPTGGTAPYTITPTQTNLAAGSYTFTVTDANGCSITVPVTITEPTPITATTAVTNVACNGGATGSVVITPAGGVGPYTITPAQTGLTAGSYTFTVTDANGCSITVPVTVTEPTPITATTAVTNVACNGGATGSVVITPTGGTAPYTITPAQTNLAAGSYTFTVTDANGCSITVPVTITEPTPITATTVVTNVACNGGATGSVVITPTGGTAPYTITPAQTNLAAGSYTFTVTDANGCSITVPVTITEPTPITATTAITNVACNGGATGSVVITPAGGVGPYTITPAQTGLTAGSYTFTVTDANGCSITVPVTITEPTPITATTAVTNVACNGGATGSVIITPTGGTAPYTITPAQTNLAAGSYTFTVTDANGCSITVPVTITEPTPITATTAVTNVACNGGATGSVVITPTGGTAPYTITPAQTGLTAGSYTFTVTDANGCSITVPVTITEPTPITAITAVTNVACNGGATGSVVITPTGGTAPYTITPAQTNLAAGSYTFTVTDANGCSITVPVTITEPTPITATTAVTNVACNGSATGSVVITPTGGTAPYTITPAQTNLAAGSYTFTVTDANGCSITVPVTITEPTPITATTAVTNVACNGGATGSVVITPTGGTAPYTITPAQTGLTAGSYTFTVTDANGCSIAVPVTITEPTPITATTIVTNVACNGGATGSVVITPAGGVGPYTITPAQTGLTAGSYTFTITDANGCSITVPVTITEPTPITATTAVTNVACNGGATGSVVITPAGGVGPYTITPAQTGLTAGSYTFTVTDANGCSITVPVTITEPTPITATTAVTNVACNGGATGSVVITPTGGTAPYTITPAQTNLAAGSYTFTVTDANGCSITVPVTITEPTPITATTAVTNVACNGGATGSVVITPAGGVGPYTITPAQTGLTAGPYTFTVTDANGCSITVPVTITEPTPITATTAVTNVACNGGATGSVVITPAGGVGPYTITPAQTGLTAGSYTFTVTDANGCSITVPVTITEPTPITATTAVTNVACNGGATGSVVITPTGGTAPYTITPAQTGLAAGSYTFTVTDANGCSITVPVTITEPTPITATTAVTNVACNGGATGSVVITPTGGTAPYTITPAQTGLTAGSYTFTVTDANGCSITVPVTITEPTPITATTAVTNVACNGGATGSVVITPAGGVGPYTITPAQTGLTAGSYTFTVTDANGCSITVPVTITEPTPITATTAVTNVACNGGATGSVVITPTGGTAPYTITPAQTNLAAGSYTFTVTDANGCSITVPVTITEPTPITATTAVTNVACNGGATGSVVITPAGGVGPYTITPAQTGLTAGSYTFTITDANGCSITVPVTITEPTPITATTAVTNVACNGGATGSVVITPTGGTAPYTITPAQTNLAAGSYTFTVTDANGCSITVPVTITEPTPITATTAVTNVACNGGATGSVVITPTGGTAPYTITPAQTNLAAGSYTFTVTDANGCSITVPVTITEPTPITATTAVTNVACNGGATGSVVITPAGGVGPYTITPAQTGLTAGSYTFTVTDANGCSITVPVTITEPTPITATAAVTNVACNGGATGSVVITPAGGVGPYTITPAQTGLTAGSYTFTVTDANGCSITVPVTITEPTPITATTAVTNVACNGGATGSVVITPTGGTAPYTITPAQTNLAAGSYTFTVTDANGCSITVPVTITEPTPITATTAVTNVACNGGATGSVVITPAGGVGPYTITPAQTGLTAGSYTFTVTDANGCSITVPVTITEPTPITATTAITNVACNGGATGSVVITPAGGVGPYTITPAQTGLTAGSYTFTVTDANGCSITVPVTITEPTPITATTAVTNVACNGGATGSVVITPTGGTAPYTITPAQTNLAAGSYTFTVTDANGCSITVPVTITEPTPITATTAVTNVACNGGATGSVVITPTGGTAPYTITPAQTNLAAGSYTFTVTDANGCSITVPVTITEPTPITATTVVTNVACNGGATGSVVITPTGGTAPYTITPAQTGLTAGSYTFTVTDANGCSITVPVTITEPTPITATTAATNVACNGGATGSVVITPAGGVGPYTITPAQTGLTAGSYTFTVTDANGCSITVPVTITEPTPITATTAVTNVACNGGATGSVVITPTGGTAPYTITPAQTNL